MAFRLTRVHGRDQEIEQTELLTGLTLADPTYQTQAEDMGGEDFAADADALEMKKSFGTPFIIEVTMNAEETGGAGTGVLTALSAGVSDVFPVYDADNADNTGTPFKFKVLDFHAVLLDESAGSAADTLQLMHVATDTTTETAITDAISLNAADDALVRCATIDNDAAVIDLTENLRLDLVLANSSNHATCVKVTITCMRCIADE